MLVTEANFEASLQELLAHQEYGLDTETTGLEWSDKLFSIVLATEKCAYYFNFNDIAPGPPRLPKSLASNMQAVFREGATFYGSNIKFDMLMLQKEGLKMHGEFFCTSSQGRVFQNNLPSYSLAVLSQWIGEKKFTDVEEYIMEHKLYDVVEIDGKKATFKRKHFHKVPLEILQPYAEHDAKIHLKLGKYLKDKIETLPNPSRVMPVNVMRNEMKLTRVCADIEYTGIRIDTEYVNRAIEIERRLAAQATEAFKKASGEYEFVDSPKALFRVFSECGYTDIPRTDKGNPSFTDENLERLGGPLADSIKRIRFHEKRIGTYYSSFLYYAGRDGVIHPNMRQGGTETGRFSYTEPNLQNIPREDKNTSYGTIVRKSFIPREDYCFVMIDYNQQEYRMLLDYAGEHKLIREILDGADVHQAMADQIGVARSVAKTLNFAVIYGASSNLVADLLAIKIPEAQALLDRYYLRLPRVRRLKKEIIEKGKMRGYVVNWAGRRCHINDVNWAYILPNHLIQGGCADVIKFSMVKIHDFLQGKRSRMLLSIHDELLFEIHASELDLIPRIREIMETTYEPFNGMKLTTSIEHSWTSWGSVDITEGEPNGNTTEIKRDSNGIHRQTAGSGASLQGTSCRP
jgi:DNA polymerase-1